MVSTYQPPAGPTFVGAPDASDLGTHPVPDRSVVPARRSRLVGVACAAGALAVSAVGSGYVYFVDPNKSSAYPGCVLKRLTGIDCPGCGGTRAYYSLLDGDLRGAVDHNVLTLLVVPLAVYLLVRFVLEQFDVHLPAPRLSPAMGWAMGVFLIAFAIVRNVPGTPLYFLNSAAN